MTATYTDNLAGNVMDNGQAQNWQYDAEGNVTSEGGKTHAFDAVGRRVKSTSTDSFYYDGDGRLVSQTYINPPPSTNPTGSKSTYYLWSTVLKENLGQIRLDGDAGNAPGSQKQYHRDVFIYVNGQQVAVRKYDQGATGSQPNLNSLVEWNHRDPLDTIARSVGSSGGSTYSVDPLGVLAVAAFQNEINNFWAPPSGGPTPPPPGFYQYSSANFSRTGISNPHAGSWGLGCSIDGIQTSCGSVLGALRTGGMGNVVGGSAVTVGAGALTPEATITISSLTMGSSWRRARTDETTIPGTGTGLKIQGSPEADIPASQDTPSTTVRTVVYEFVGAISGDLVFGGGQQGNAQNQGVQPSCRAFVRSLVDILRNSSSRDLVLPGVLGRTLAHDKIGNSMVKRAVDNVDVDGNSYRKGPSLPEGFKQELIDNGQGGDVYHHIEFVAGQYFLGTTGQTAIGHS